MSHKKKMVLLGVGAVALLAVTAGASAFIATNVANDKDVSEPQKVASAETIRWDDAPAPQQQAQQPVAKSCDDANIVGAAIGAVAGGLAGNQIGSGRGQDLATIGGAIGGGYLGKEYIPTRNTLCP